MPSNSLTCCPKKNPDYFCDSNSLLTETYLLLTGTLSLPNLRDCPATCSQQEPRPTTSGKRWRRQPTAWRSVESVITFYPNKLTNITPVIVCLSIYLGFCYMYEVDCCHLFCCCCFCKVNLQGYL